jgi:dipeptidyl aminopeptidase/acylaminoacyl peptidase
MVRPLARSLFAVAFAAIPLVAPAAQTPTPASGKKVLNLEDYGRWQRISGTAITPDGKWMTYILTPNEGGEASLRIKPIDGGAEVVIGLGGAAGGRGGGGRGGGGGGGAPAFSDDSKWVTYTAPVATPRGGAAGRGGPPAPTPAPGGRGTAPAGAAAPAPATRLELRNLATGAVQRFANVASSSFSPGTKYLVLRMNRPTGAPAGLSGADLVLHDLASGMDRNIGNVGQFAFNQAGTLLAFTVDAPEKLGNGLFVLDPTTGATHTLAADAADFDGLTWHANGTAIAVLRGTKAATQKHRVNTLHAWTGVTASSARAVVFDPATVSNFPKDFVVSEYSAPRWSTDGARLFIGIKAQEPEVAAADSVKANVDVWHYKDQTVQSVQIVQIQQQRRATLPAVVELSTGTFTALGTDAMRAVTMAANGTVGIGRDDSAYRGEIAWGGSRADFYKVDVATGERSLIAKAIQRTYGTSPNSRYFLYAEGKAARVFDLTTGRTATLDASGTPLKSYINEDDDHAYELPLWGTAGWTRDGNAVLLYDKYDVWSVPLNGSKATNVTRGVGRAQQIQFRVTSFGGGGGGGGGRGGAGNSDTVGVDLSKPLTLSAYGDRSKKYGYWTVTAGSAPQPIVWEDRNIGGIIKADSTDRMLYTQQKFDEYPNVWVTNGRFQDRRQLTDANPITAEYAWSAGKVLIDYTNSKGQKLQGTLALPAGYEPGKKYPMLVSFYEIVSNTHHNFSQPGYSNSPQLSTYNSNGYLTFQPDMVYEIGRPGTSALDNMTAAVKKVIELGYVDPKRIGLHGHSWSGYQSAFILTQTNLFAAVVSGAPPTNLISFYNTLYKSSGTVQQGITTVGQVRMGKNVTPFNNPKLYMEQSPIFHVDKITTPFMILHGTEDGAVDYVEGLQFFNAARAAGKPGILLSYPGEAHNLTNRDNQKDFTIRMKQFFDHHLKGEPAPQWLREGLPQVNKGSPIK